MTLSDITHRLLEDQGYVVRVPAPGRPGEQTAVLTGRGIRANAYTEDMHQLLLQAYALILYKLGESAALFIARREDINPADLEPHFRSLAERGLMTRSASGDFALTSSGEAAVAAFDAQHPTGTRSLRVLPSQEGLPMAGTMKGDHGSHRPHSAHQKGTRPALTVVRCHNPENPENPNLKNPNLKNPNLKNPENLNTGTGGDSHGDTAPALPRLPHFGN